MHFSVKMYEVCKNMHFKFSSLILLIVQFEFLVYSVEVSRERTEK